MAGLGKHRDKGMRCAVCIGMTDLPDRDEPGGMPLYRYLDAFCNFHRTWWNIKWNRRRR